MAEIGVTIDFVNGIPTTMYGVESWWGQALISKWKLNIVQVYKNHYQKTAHSKWLLKWYCFSFSGKPHLLMVRFTALDLKLFSR
jgi:hypothetical protein